MLSGTVSNRRFRTLWPVAALAIVFLLDAALRARSWSVPVIGLLDEPAHLLTAWLALSVLPGERLRALRPWALVGSVVIDVDHVPLYLWPDLVSANGGRPVTHCLLMVLLPATIGAVLPRVRTPAWGLAIGLPLHFIRDVASAPGAPLLWPVDASGVRLPYALYAAALIVIASAAVFSSRRSGVAGAPR